MFSGIRSFKMLILAAGDVLAAYLALAFTLLLRYGQGDFAVHWSGHVRPFTVIFAVWFVIFYIVGLYDFDALRSRIEMASRAAEGLLSALLVSIAVFYAVPSFEIAPKTNLVIAIALYAALLAGWRLLTMHLFSRDRFRLKTLFLGGGAEAASLCEALSANPHLGYTCVAKVDEGSQAELPACDVIVVARGLHGNRELTARLYRKFFEAVTVVDLPTFYEKIRHSVPESALDERWIVDNLATQEAAVYEHGKRLFDLLCAALFAVPALAVAPFVALLVWIDDRGPVFYRQARVGQGGRVFSIVKFRTMRVDAEKHGAAFAQQDDPRVTRVGRFLRATRLDELPQLWNILRGEMSFVGPRPERPEIESELSKTIPLFPVRHLARPGLTGWAQVSAPYAATREDHLLKLRHDLYYLKYRSMALDVAIVLKTAYSVLKRKGR
ncbi:MAG TPA: sugar transferase [Patescibacteria group bacterium]|nr:sugar transferase [Patescibacteria group bacterium]